MITTPLEIIQRRARIISDELDEVIGNHGDIHLLNLSSRVGGGALPLLNLPSQCIGVSIRGISANAIELFLRNYSPPIIGRIEADQFILDPRTIQNDDISMIKIAFAQLVRASHSK
jgi:L-seryl-tRNA(Ser) seleniumtransferase